MFKIKHLLNEQINLSKVRVVGDSGISDIINLEEALKIADEKDLDLVLMTKSDNVGICKLMNYSKYEYEMHKKDKLNSKNKHEVKEIKIGPSIALNDMRVKAKSIDKFLSSGHKVKISLMYKGRQTKLMSSGKDKLSSLLSLVTHEYIVSTKMKQDGNRIMIVIEGYSK